MVQLLRRFSTVGQYFSCKIKQMILNWTMLQFASITSICQSFVLLLVVAFVKSLAEVKSSWWCVFVVNVGASFAYLGIRSMPMACKKTVQAIHI